jgi:hypothetical protein
MSGRGRTARAESLRERLDTLYASYDQPDSVADPVNVVRRYRAPDDLEVAAFCAASLAFGRVASVIQSVEALLAAMAPSPAAFVRAFDPVEGTRLFETFVHRWTRGPDIVALLWILRQMVERAGSIEGFFVEGDDPAAPDVGPALDAFSKRALAIDTSCAYGHRVTAAARRGLLLSVSLGGQRLQAAQPVPAVDGAARPGGFRRLDARVARAPGRPARHARDPPGKCLGLTRYQSPGWKMASEITAALRVLDPDDPVRYDFSLCHVGMMGACGFGTPRGDAQCPLRGCCRPRRGGRAGAR